MKCSKVIAIDTNPKKEEWAKKFGASESIHSDTARQCC